MRKYLEESKKIQDAAGKELGRVCENNFTMKICIPPEAKDSDFLIGAGLFAGKKATKALEIAGEELDRMLLNLKGNYPVCQFEDSIKLAIRRIKEILK